MSFSREYKDWMTENKGVIVGRGKRKHYILFDCPDNTSCKGCEHDDNCDICGIRLCTYLAKYVDDELHCPKCWESIGCPIDDRSKEE